MPSITVSYEWTLREAFSINFNFDVVAKQREMRTFIVGTKQPNNIYMPTLLFPNGGEVIRAREIEISWLESNPASTDRSAIWFELFYSENYDLNTEPDWKMIATVPSGAGKFIWKIGNTIKSKKLRVAVRGINASGERSDMSISAAAFTVQKEPPISPTVLSPMPRSRHDNFIKFIFDDSSILNSFSQRAKYYIYFSCLSLNIPLTVIAQNIPVNTGPIVWDTSTLPSAYDYVLSVFLQDDDGNRSQEVDIRDVAVVHDKFFLIDTEPPTGYIQINNANEFTKNNAVHVKVYTHDEATASSAIKIIEKITKEESQKYSIPEETQGSPQPNLNDLYWSLTDFDGIKTLYLTAQDYGNNTINQNNLKAKFRTLYNGEVDKNIADIIINYTDNSIYVAFNEDSPVIYKFAAAINLPVVKSFITFVEKPIVSIAFYNDVLYIALDTNNKVAQVLRWNGTQIEEAFTLTNVDSQILSMTAYKNNLFFGCLNGALYAYDGNTVTLLRIFTSSVHRIYTDNNLLYIINSNSKVLTIYNQINFTEVLL